MENTEKPKPLTRPLRARNPEQTPSDIKRVLEEVERTIELSKLRSSLHRLAIEEAREGNIEKADLIEDLTQALSRIHRKTPLFTKKGE